MPVWVPLVASLQSARLGAIVLQFDLSDLTDGTLKLSNLCRDIYHRLQKTDYDLFATSPSTLTMSAPTFPP
jgi:hypothetical protein